jgi:hypothetical protein
MEEFKGEKIEADGPGKKVCYYYDSAAGIKQISHEVHKKTGIIVHYPRGYEGGEKYKTIRKFIYKGYKDNKNLPVGVIKSVSYGWGFTKTLNPFTYYIDENFDIEEVFIERKGKTELDLANKVLYLNEEALKLLNNTFSAVYKKQKADIAFTVKTLLHSLFPIIVPKETGIYTPNTLAVSLSSWGNSIDEFSEDDKNAIKSLFEKLSLGANFLNIEALAKTKEIIDTKYIQETLIKYKSLMALKNETESVEKQWQEFLNENSWIFSSIFAQPIILFKREAYVGGKCIDNQNGKFNDFLIKNKLSNNISFLEIKTHKTKLIEKNAYRGEDVFCASKELTGCVVQVLNQRDNFQKEFYSLKAKSEVKRGGFESFNSKCVVLVGSLKGLDKNQQHSFELYRSNSKDVEILTFDELQQKIESLQSILKQ